MKKMLLLFTKEFPYGFSEPFLENEYPLYKKYFDKVIIVTNHSFSKDNRLKKRHMVNDSTIEILENNFNKNFLKIIKFIFFAVTDLKFYSEFFKILFFHKANKESFKNMFTTIAKANLCLKIARSRVRQLERENYKLVAAYSYWLIYPAYAAVKFSKKYYKGKLFTISRAHGFDLYEERNIQKYIPLRKYILNGLSEIAPISEDGEKYLLSKYPNYNMNLCVYRLGAKDNGIFKNSDKGDILKIVSCSRLVPLKRIDKLIDALRKVSNIKIEWTHFGGGELFDSIVEKAKSLPSNIKCKFTNAIPNEKIYEFYKNNDYDIFINVSKNEGIPVSIMEAMSFGIPIIATNVGGNSEVVSDGYNGFLLKKNFSDEELISIIEKFYNMPKEEYCEFREHSRKKFEMDYNATTNYTKFIENIIIKSEI